MYRLTIVKKAWEILVNCGLEGNVHDHYLLSISLYEYR